MQQVQSNYNKHNHEQLVYQECEINHQHMCVNMSTLCTYERLTLHVAFNNHDSGHKEAE